RCRGRAPAGHKPLALGALARELAGAAHGLGLLARPLLGGLLVMAAHLHFAEDALAPHLLLERPESLIDIVVADENLHVVILCSKAVRARPQASAPATNSPRIGRCCYQKPARLSTGSSTCFGCRRRFVDAHEHHVGRRLVPGALDRLEL